MPKTVTIAFGDSTFTGGLLRPALVMPPVEMDGEFDASAVSVNVTFGSASDNAVIVIGPGLLPSVTMAVTVPSFRVMAGVGLTVAAPSGLTVKVTTTPGTPAPVLSAIFSTKGAVKPVSTVALWPLPLTMLMLTGFTVCGVSIRT